MEIRQRFPEVLCLETGGVVASAPDEANTYNGSMSDDQQQPDPIQPSPYSQPTSGGGLLLRAVLMGVVVLAAVVGIVWYAAQK